MTGNVFFAIHVLDYTEFEFGEFRSIALYTAKYLSTTRESDNEDLRNAETYTERVRVIGLALVAATRFCQSNGIKPKTEKCTEIFSEISNFMEDLTYATQLGYIFEDDEPKPEELKKLHNFRLKALSLSRLEVYLEKEDIHHDSREINRLVSEYLSSSFRSDELDSFLFKLLAEEEVIQFIHHMVYKNPHYPHRNQDTRYEKALKHVKALNTPMFISFFKGFFSNCLLTFVFFGCAYLLEQYKFVEQDNSWPITIASILTCLVWGFYIFGIFLMKSLRKQFVDDPSKDHYSREVNLVHKMSNFFEMMRTTGKVSIDRIEKKLNELEEAGAVMPETLHVFIDDLRSKGIQSI